MSAPTFLQVLKAEVSRMQSLHPDREGELARATALIANGMVAPSADDPATGQVLSSDLSTMYSVNGVCSCQAGQHDKMCKHRQAWLLYLHITRKVAAQPPEVLTFESNNAPLPEAPCSVNVRLQVAGREVQWALRDSDEERLATRLEALLARYPAPTPAATQGPAQGQAPACHYIAAR